MGLGREMESGGLIYIYIYKKPCRTLKAMRNESNKCSALRVHRSVSIISPPSLNQNVSLCSCSSVFSHDCFFPTPSMPGISTVSYDDDDLANDHALDFGFVYDVPDPTGHQTPYHRHLDVTYRARSHPDTAESFPDRRDLRN